MLGLASLSFFIRIMLDYATSLSSSILLRIFICNYGCNDRYSPFAVGSYDRFFLDLRTLNAAGSTFLLLSSDLP